MQRHGDAAKRAHKFRLSFAAIGLGRGRFSREEAAQRAVTRYRHAAARRGKATRGPFRCCARQSGAPHASSTH